MEIEDIGLNGQKDKEWSKKMAAAAAKSLSRVRLWKDG